MDAMTLFLLVVGSVLVYLVVTIARSFLWPLKPIDISEMSRSVGEITLEELSKFSGADPFRPLLLALKGNVYDVTKARNFYGPGGAYQLFAGREVARALGKMSIKEEECNAELDDLSEKELSTLGEWEKKFQEKYKIVGRIVPPKMLTLEELSEYDGMSEEKPILLAVRGVIFDVSKGRDFYGPDGSYPFGGKECARALAKFSTELEGMICLKR